MTQKRVLEQEPITQISPRDAFGELNSGRRIVIDVERISDGSATLQAKLIDDTNQEVCKYPTMWVETGSRIEIVFSGGNK